MKVLALSKIGRVFFFFGLFAKDGSHHTGLDECLSRGQDLRKQLQSQCICRLTKGIQQAREKKKTKKRKKDWVGKEVCAGGSLGVHKC